MGLLSFFSKVLNPENPEMYVPVKTANGQCKVIVPYAGKIPANLGPNPEETVRKAELLFDSDYLREKWLEATIRLKETTTGWVLEPKDPLNPAKPGWGLTSRGSVSLTA